MAKPKILAINLSYNEIAEYSNSLAGSYRFHFARCIQDAMAVSAQFKPSVMVYEIGMPNDETVDTFLALKSSISEKTPVISIADENSLRVEQSVRMAGVFYYLVKPYATEELSRILKAAVVYANQVVE